MKECDATYIAIKTARVWFVESIYLSRFKNENALINDIFTYPFTNWTQYIQGVDYLSLQSRWRLQKNEFTKIFTIVLIKWILLTFVIFFHFVFRAAFKNTIRILLEYLWISFYSCFIYAFEMKNKNKMILKGIWAVFSNAPHGIDYVRMR